MAAGRGQGFHLGLSGDQQPVYRPAAGARHERRTSALDEVAEPEDGAASALAGAVEADRMAALEAALAQLPERQREAVVLRHLEGLTNPGCRRSCRSGWRQWKA